MAGSAADTPTTPEFVRVSDDDRDRAVDELRKEFVDGRLSHDTFMLRMHAALDARSQGDLSGLFYDLPVRAGPLTRVRQTVRRWRRTSVQLVSDVLPVRRQEDPYYPDPGYDEAPSRAPAVPEAESAPRPLMFPPGPDTSFTIGRDQRCDLYIADMTVSRLHARLDRGPDGWLLCDLGSSNGTRVNGWRLRAAVPVRPGDMITFGSAVFVLQPAGLDGGLPRLDGGLPRLDGEAAGLPERQAEEGNPGHLEG
jgi:FHA domain/Domain of unknown function (DUF1707)